MKQILLIDKPVGWTSFDVVARIRGELRKKLSEKGYSSTNLQRPTSNDSRTKVRVGHAGTLDPFATGLLIILIGEATKEQDKYMKLDKEYAATLRLGFTSKTGDPEGIITKNEKPKTNNPDITQIEEVLESFTGKISQIPPTFSAIKVNGKRAYKLARAGQQVELKPREVTIYELRILEYDYPELKIEVRCSSGTYIRTLAEDIGKSLGCGAYLTELRRTKIGTYDVKNAETVELAIKNL